MAPPLALTFEGATLLPYFIFFRTDFQYEIHNASYKARAI